MRRTRASNIQSEVDQGTQTTATYPVKTFGVHMYASHYQIQCIKSNPGNTITLLILIQQMSQRFV